MELSLDPQDDTKLLLTLPSGTHVGIVVSPTCGQILLQILRSHRQAERQSQPSRLGSPGAPIQYIVDAWSRGEAPVGDTTFVRVIPPTSRKIKKRELTIADLEDVL